MTTGATMQVFITGGTGLIGSRLVRRLAARGDRPVVLTRREAAAQKMFGADCRVVEGDPMRPGPWQTVAADCDAVVNLGGPIGDGKQWMSWIHHEDITGLILFALDRQEVAGPLNGTAPNPVTNRDFSTALGKALHRLSAVPTPTFMLRAMLGEVAQV